jgi:hypothetical protein
VCGSCPPKLCFVCGGGASDAAPITVCTVAGCRAPAHSSCRELLARRIVIPFDQDQIWYWGTASAASGTSVTVTFDDGTKGEDEDMEKLERDGELVRLCGDKEACAYMQGLECTLCVDPR